MQNEYKALADSYENAIFSFNDFKVGGVGGSRIRANAPVRIIKNM